MAALTDIGFAEMPPVGLALVVRGVRYDLTSIEPYTRNDGIVTSLLVWMGECATCCRPFVVRSSSLRMPATRRCPEHRQPGKANVQ